jgi:hydroxymethylpyrimidine/phosphomethylpyrimidine kinase
MRIPAVLTIAGSDSSGGAGIQADLKTYDALGVYGMSAITALTAQNTTAVTGISEVPAEFVAQQIDAVVADIRPDAVKTGMLANAAIARTVAELVRRHGLPNLVVDPVMVAKSGARLLREDAVAALRDELLPLAEVVTPNIPEAEDLTGLRIDGLGAMREAAERIAAMGAKAVVVKGGHGEGDTVVDVLFDGSGFREFAGPRIRTTSTHGTGCTFASAIAAFLARGLGVAEAVGRAREYLQGAIEHAYPVGRGHGPVHHFWRLWPKDGG